MNITEKKLEKNLKQAKSMILHKKQSRYFCKSEIKIPQKSFVLLCGTPGSGKTTVARKICEQFKDSVHIDIDYLFDCSTKELYPNKELLTGEDIDCIAENAFDKAYSSAKDSLEKRSVVVWDDLEIFPTDRVEVLNELDEYAYVILVVINCDSLKAIFRSINRGDTQTRTNLILDTHKYLQLQLQNPSKYFIGFNEVYIIDDAEKVTIKEP